MSQPAQVEKMAESGASGFQHPYSTPFIMKTYQLVDDPTEDDTVSWNNEGTAFIVWRIDEFARDVLPKYFKHNNFASFVRQLNSYGFKKVGGERWEFANEYFKRGEKELLRQIIRKIRKPSGATCVTTAAPVSSSTVAATATATSSGSENQVVSSSALLMWSGAATTVSPVYNSTAYLKEENEWLRKENAALRAELKRWRGMCGNVANMMATFAAGEACSTAGGSFTPLRNSKKDTQLEVEKNQDPQLFGVAIGAKPTDKRVEKSGE